MTTALTIIKPRDVAEARDFAMLVAQSAMLQPSLRGRPEDVFAIMLAGMELGLGPMQALRSISIIQGRPAMNAELMVGLAKQNPRCKYFRLVESTNERAVYETLQEGSPEPERSEYTMDDARREGLANKDNWKRMPAQMLRARASSALARLAYQDSVLGIVAREEMGQEAVDVAYEEVKPSGLDVEKFDGMVERMPPEMQRAPHPEGYQSPFVPPANAVPFPVDDNSEREKMLVEEAAERKRNSDDLHAMVNAVYPGDKNKSLRKDKYAMFGLKMANPIKQFMGLPLEKQRLILKDVERWHAIASGEVPEWPSEVPPITEEEARRIKEEEKNS